MTTAIFRHLAILAALLCIALSPAAAKEVDAVAPAPPISKWFEWESTAKAPSYPKASAHDPHYEDKKLWPFLTEKEAYFKQVWPTARLLTWAKPGEDGPWDDVKSWLEDGKPTAKIPDKDTDVFMPEAAKPYFAKCPEGTVYCRHITLEKNSHLHGGDAHEIAPYGNIWVKVGANLAINQAVPHGPLNSFHRNDHNITRNEHGHADGRPGPWKTDWTGHYIASEKDANASVEYLGNHHPSDKIGFRSGTTIIGPDSCIMSGGWNRPIILPPATLVLMSGAIVGQREFNDGRWAEDSLRVDGKLMIGTIERPIERDAVISLNFKDNATFVSARGMIVSQSGSIETHSKDPKTARLVFRWSGREEAVEDKDHDKNGFRSFLYGGADVPRRINLLIQGKADLDGVLFMDMNKGGIQLTDLAVKDAWKNVQFGVNNAGGPDELYAVAGKKVVGKKKPGAAAATSGGDGNAVSGKPRYETYVWDAGRQLTWAKPGTAGDPMLAASWLEDGKPATLAPDRDCDLIIPDAGSPYTIGSEKTENIAARSVTIGKNVTLTAHQAIIYGNIWVKAGARFTPTLGLILKGQNHCFVRSDNPPIKDKDGQPVAGPKGLVFRDLYIQKGYIDDDTSVEFLGFIDIEHCLGIGQLVNNESRHLASKQLIVGPDATLTWGGPSGDSRNSRLMGNVILMSGATFQRRNNGFHGRFDIETGAWRQVGIQAGTPDRPLTKDCYLGLSAVENNEQYSLFIDNNPGGNTRFVVNSSDPTKHRLVVRWNGHTSEALTKRGGKPHIVLGIFNGCDLDGVLFDNVAKGDIRIGDLGIKHNWKNIAFGPACEGKGDEMYSQSKKP